MPRIPVLLASTALALAALPAWADYAPGANIPTITPDNNAGTLTFTYPGAAPIQVTFIPQGNAVSTLVNTTGSPCQVMLSTASLPYCTAVPTPAETLAVATPSTQTAGVQFNVTGTYTNGPPAALDYSVNGGSYTAATSPTISGGTFAFPVTLASAGTASIAIRDHATQTITATSASFTVAAAAQPLALGGATFTPTSNVSSMTASQASTGAPIVLTAPAALNTSNKQGVVTSSVNAGSYIFDVTNTTPGATFYNAGLLILGDGGAVGALDGFYNVSGGVSYEVDEWGGSNPYGGTSQTQLASGNVQSFTGSGVRHCLKAVITRGPDNINLLASPYSTTSGTCPQGGWVSFYSYAAGGLGYAKQLGPFVDPLDAPQNGAAANGKAATISLNRYAYTSSTDPQAGF